MDANADSCRFDASLNSSRSGAVPIGLPLRVDDPDSVPWDSSCDVLIVGFGAAGAAAAIEAARSGASVIAVDRFGGGGASAKSGGVVYAGGGTRYQEAAGYHDTPEAMFDYLRREVGVAVSEQALLGFCRQSADMIRWLESLGVSFGSTVPPKKTSYPPDGYYLYFSGNEAVPEYAGPYPPAPRGHRVKGSGLSGAILFCTLRDAALAAGVTLITQSAVRRLVILASSGAVVGAEAWRIPPGSSAARRHRRLSRAADRFNYYGAAALSDVLRRRALAIESASARPILMHARGGVVLSTGGFIFNRAMVERHAPAYLRNLRLGTSGCDGSGIRLGLSVGGESARLERVSAWRFINPPHAWARGMIVDVRGERFCNEEVYGARLGHEMCEHHHGHAWLILDAALRREAMREALFGGLWLFQSIPAVALTLRAKRARSIDGLAQRMRADPAMLRRSWESYNLGARGGKDAFGKSLAMLHALERPPFYALDVSVESAAFPCPAITLGGLKVIESSGAVVRSDGSTVPGLYAVGRAAVGIASNNYVSGLALADCIWSGRQAGSAAGLCARAPNPAVAGVSG